MAQTKDRVKIITSKWNDETNTLHISVAGQTDLQLAMSRVSEANRLRFMRHGVVQRISDAAALERNTADGSSATPEAKHAAMARLVAHYDSGTEDWSPAREGGTIGLDPVILAAVAEFAKKPVEAIRAMVEAKAVEHKTTQRAYLARLGAGPKIAPIVDRMRGEQAPGVDVDADLDELTVGRVGRGNGA